MYFIHVKIVLYSQYYKIIYKFVHRELKYMKKIVVGLVVLFAILLVSYKYLYHAHRDISNEKAVFSVTVKQVSNDFLQDEAKANLKYLDKSIQITGKVTNVDIANKTIVLDEKVFVLLNDANVVKLNETILVKGRVIGYDSLLEEIKIDQAEIK